MVTYVEMKIIKCLNTQLGSFQTILPFYLSGDTNLNITGCNGRVEWGDGVPLQPIRILNVALILRKHLSFAVST